MRVHLCCGPIDKMEGWVNVDACNFGQEVVADIAKHWEFASDGAVSEIYCKDGFEHVDSAEHFLGEVARVLHAGGRLTIWVPHYKNPSAYRMTHKRLLSWSYFNAFPEPHDAVQDLRVISNKIYIGHKESKIWAVVHVLINLIPKWWERIGYVSNIEVVFEKR
ncbi:MAG: methyltransferase domain-containing protein [Nitrospira sp.]|nr:methyltransferase domain-containing protein [Nitrospira sp.]